MTTAGRIRSNRWTLLFSLAAAIAIVVSGLGWWIAIAENSRLDSISPCYGGNGLSAGCPPAIGATFVQVGHGQLVGGAYVYTFAVTPQPPPEVHASSLAIRAYNASSNASVSLLNVTLSFPNGSLLASYHAVGGTWTTASSADIWEVDLLVFTSSTNLSGERVFIWDSAARNGLSAPLA